MQAQQKLFNKIVFTHLRKIKVPQFAFDKVQSFQIAPSVALLFFFLCLVFKVQLRVGIPSKLNNVRRSEKADLRKSVGVVTHMSP